MIDAPPEPPCQPGTAPAAEIRARDLEDSGGSLTATHTIVLEVETSEGTIDEFDVEVPPGVELRRAGPSPAFRSDTPGPVPLRATWRHFDPVSGSDCAASAEATFDLAPAKPLRYVGPPRRDSLMNSLEWRVPFGKNSDLRPVELRVRGVRRARLPRPRKPFETLTFALRRGDPGLAVTGPPHRILRAAGWRFYGAYHGLDEILVTMRGVPRGRRFGFELELVQADRVLGRTRVVGRCDTLTCRYRTVRR